MNCLKCGAQTENSGVFCDHCLEQMVQRPVKQGTPLHFPVRETQAAPKNTHRKRKSLDPEEKLSRLRKTLLGLIALILVLGAALGITVRTLLQTQEQLDEALLTGKNYMVETTPAQ